MQSLTSLVPVPGRTHVWSCLAGGRGANGETSVVEKSGKAASQDVSFVLYLLHASGRLPDALVKLQHTDK